MSKLIAEIKTLLQDPVRMARYGTVVDVKYETVSIKTINGTKDYRAANPSQYRIGDQVRVQGDVLIGKIVSAASVPTFQV